MRISRSGFLISQVKHMGGRVFDRLLLEAGVDAFNGAQGRILDALWQADGLPAHALAKQTGLARNTLTGMLDRMESMGLIARTPDRHDRRVTLIHLTEKSHALRARYEALSMKMNDIYFQGFSDDEITNLEGYLERIIKNLQEAHPNEQGFHAAVQ